jgi:ribosomal protein L37AE/L43A
MSNCPCCSHTMLRHIRSNQVYWFCRNCWQEMPNFEQHRSTSILVHLSITLGIGEQQAALIKI